MPKKRKLSRAETLRVPSIEAPREAARRIGALLVVQGADADLGRQVVCNQPVTIGRDDEAELALCDGSISRRHCRVERDEETGYYMLVDLGSTNGTSVNEHRVEGRYPLTTGDKIFLGASVLRFTLSDPVDLEYESRVTELVTTDPLTGLGSRRHYDVTFPALADRAAEEHAELAMLVMDLDGIKSINDRFGHEMGGFAICEAAGLVHDVLAAEEGTVCRFGGDEFVAFFFGVSRRRACRLAEAVRDRIANHVFEREGVRVEPTISIGVAAYPEDVDDPRELFAVADEALYRAKRAGRNRVATPASTLY